MDRLGNPLLAEVSALSTDARRDPAVRDALIARYAFAIPTDAALDAIVDASPHGVVEVGAGSGYWARLLHDRGAAIEAYDLHPPPAQRNPWFAGMQPWFEVRRGDATVADHAPPATLLLVWPTRDETWATQAAQRHHAAHGSTLVFVGEGPGGHTGDDGFHAVLGEVSDCLHCRYGVLSSACICGIEPLWGRVREIAIPTWPGFDDSVRIYSRSEPRRGVAAFGRRRRRFTRRP